MSRQDESKEANPHPESSHREPRQIATDERGPTGPRPAQTPPVRTVNPNERIDAESTSDTERRKAVKRSARKQATEAEHEVGASSTAQSPPREPRRDEHSPPQTGRSRH